MSSPGKNLSDVHIAATGTVTRFKWSNGLVLTISGVRRKFSWGEFHSMPDGGHLHLVCAVCAVII